MRAVGVFLALALASCGSDPCAKNPELCQDGGNGTCTGQCFSIPWDWEASWLLWTGPEDAAPPSCPDIANFGDLGYIDAPPTTLECPSCTCTPSSGSCELTSAMTAHKDACPGTATKAIPFNAPEPWDGTCTVMDAIPSASSLLAPAPYEASQSQCFGSDGKPTKIGGGTRAETCVPGNFTLPGLCPNPGDRCGAPKVDGFALCVAQFGDLPCPEGWPNKRLYYDDRAECVCICGKPTGERCTTTLTVYSDGACTQPLGSTMLSSDQPDVCIDTAPGSMFGSKAATPPTYQSGTCPATLYKSEVLTLCCLP